MSKVTNCLGCGTLLQTNAPTQRGYVENENQIYCKSCFQLKNYGIATEHFHPNDLPELKRDSLIVMVSSIMHLDMLFSYRVDRYYPDAKYVYIINQLDLLPKSTNLDHLLNEIENKARLLKIPYENIVFMSAIKKYDLEQLKAYLETFKQKNIYLLGVQNSGKTTIFKGITNNSTALNIKKAALTQEALKEEMNGKTIWDMPGLYQEGYLHQLLEYKDYKNLLPDKTIKPTIYQVQEGNTVMIEGLISVSLLKGNKNTFVFYFKDQINFHRTTIAKVDDLLRRKQELFKYYTETYETKTFKLDKNIKYQITFADMGILHVNGPATLEIKHAQGLHVTLMEALFK